ncbi:hypothetical protein BDZ89DRAFT_1115952, partial [Hymenopellis radicata]
MTVLSPTVTVLAPFLPPYSAFIAFIVSLIIVTVTSTVVLRRTTPTNARTIRHLSLTPHWVEGYSLPPMVYGTACLLVGAILVSSFTLMFDLVVRLCFGLTSIKDDTLPVLYAFILLVAILGVFDDNLRFMGTRIALFNNEQQQSINMSSACIAAERVLADKVETITPKATDPRELPMVLNPPIDRPDTEPLPLSSTKASSSRFSLGSTPPASLKHISRALLDVITPSPISTPARVERAAHCHQATAAQLIPDTQDEVMSDNSYNPTLGDENEDTHSIVSVSVGVYTIQTTKVFQAETFATLNSIYQELQQQKQFNNELNKTLGCKSQQLEKQKSALKTLQNKCSRLENNLEARLDNIRALDDRIYSQDQEIRSKDYTICVRDDTILKQTRLLANLKKQITPLQNDKDKFRDIADEQATLYRESRRESLEHQIEKGRLQTELALAQETVIREHYESLEVKRKAEMQLAEEIQAFERREKALKALLTEKNADLEQASSDLDDVRAERDKVRADLDIVCADRDKAREELRKASKKASVPIAPSTPPQRSIPRSTRTVPATTSYSCGFSRTPASTVKPPPNARKVDSSAVLTPISNHVGYRRTPSPLKVPTRISKAGTALPSSRTLTRRETLLPRFNGTKPHALEDAQTSTKTRPASMEKHLTDINEFIRDIDFESASSPDSEQTGPRYRQYHYFGGWSPTPRRDANANGLRIYGTTASQESLPGPATAISGRANIVQYRGDRSFLWRDAYSGPKLFKFLSSSIPGSRVFPYWSSLRVPLAGNNRVSADDEGTQDRAGGWRDSVTGDLKGDKTQQIQGNVRREGSERARVQPKSLSAIDIMNERSQYVFVLKPHGIEYYVFES